MKVATTIQLNPDEDREVLLLKEGLKLPSKKAVVLEGLRTLHQILENEKRRRRLQTASRAIREESQRINREWAPRAAALRAR